MIGLAEMMNFPGVLAHDEEVLEKLAAFDGAHVDGHCPLVRGYELNAYASCGIRNCHESTSLEEAAEKLRKGLQVLVRDGSVSKDVDALSPLISEQTWPFLAFCTDDRNPLDIALEGHIDHLIRKAIANGAPVLPTYRAATWAAARGFGLRGPRPRGAGPARRPGAARRPRGLRGGHGHPARTSRRRRRRSRGARCSDPVGRGSVHLEPVTPEVFRVPATGASSPVIGVLPGKILTEHLQADLPYRDGLRHADPEHDLLKICVLARHGTNQNVGRGFVQGLRLPGGRARLERRARQPQRHVVGASDEDMAVAVNRLIELQGGFVAVRGGRVLAELPLPIAGLMTELHFGEVRDRLLALRQAVEAMGCPLEEAFLQLAFLPLPVIPHLKITDRGLVDVDRFALLPA